MPYKLLITKEDVEKQLQDAGFTNLSDDFIEETRKELIFYIKQSLREIRRQKLKQRGELGRNGAPQTSTPNSVESSEASSLPSSTTLDSQHSAIAFGSEMEKIASSSSRSISSGSSTQWSLASKEEINNNRVKAVKTLEKKTKEKEIPKYPSKPDPVNLYHYYRKFWEKYKPPGEDSRAALRWEVRTKLFYSS